MQRGMREGLGHAMTRPRSLRARLAAARDTANSINRVAHSIDNTLAICIAIARRPGTPPFRPLSEKRDLSPNLLCTFGVVYSTTH